MKRSGRAKKIEKILIKEFGYDREDLADYTDRELIDEYEDRTDTTWARNDESEEEFFAHEEW